MEILIKTNAYCSSIGSTDVAQKFFNENRGKWVKVETEHLFNDQYNTAKVRVHDSQVQAIRNDAREGKGKCKYCGSIVEAGNVCTKYIEENKFGDKCSDYGIEWFTAKNTFFLARPNGIDPMPEKIKMEDEPKFGTYRLSYHDGGLDYYTLQNARTLIKFRWDTKNQCYWIGDTIGGTRCESFKSKKAPWYVQIKAKSFDESKLKAFLNEHVGYSKN